MSVNLAEVAPGLFVGNLESLQELNQNQITHVVSVLNYDLAAEQLALLFGKEHKQLNIVDINEFGPSTDLLTHFPASCEFLKAGIRSGGAALVHCAAGVSRSVTVAVAYILYAKICSTIDVALDIITKKWPIASPNDCFKRQLQLWQSMSAQLIRGHNDYEQYRRIVLKASWEANPHSISLMSVAEPSATPPQPAPSQRKRDTSPPRVPEMVYRCRGCKRLLATSDQIVRIEATDSAEQLSASQLAMRKKRDEQQRGVAGYAGDNGGAIYVDPLAWMEDQITGVNDAGLLQDRGDLQCPDCAKKLGKFSWYGLEGPRGEIVVPAFLLHLKALNTTKVQVPGSEALGDAGMKIHKPMLT